MKHEPDSHTSSPEWSWVDNALDWLDTYFGWILDPQSWPLIFLAVWVWALAGTAGLVAMLIIGAVALGAWLSAGRH